MASFSVDSVVRIQPLNQRSMIMTARIADVVLHDPTHHKSFTQLKAQHWIINCSRLNTICIFLRC